jgi:hypothetical protein
LLAEEAAEDARGREGLGERVRREFLESPV